MTELANQTKQGSQAKAAPTPMTNDESSLLVDLLLQKAAHQARVVSSSDDKQLRQQLPSVLSDARQASGALTVPGTHGLNKRALDSVDALMFTLRELGERATHIEPSLGRDVAVTMKQVADAFEPLGWEEMAGNDEATRIAVQRSGTDTLTMSERGQLARVHVVAARQHLLGNWNNLTAGDISPLAIATFSLDEARALTLDPNVTAHLGDLAAEIANTEQAISTTFLYFEQRNANRSGPLRQLGAALDKMLAVVGREPSWAARATAPEPPKSSVPPAKAGEPTQDRDAPAAPRAEPALNRTVDEHTLLRRVYLRDTNFTDEELGIVFLEAVFVKTASGQIYCRKSKVIPDLSRAALKALSFGANVLATSIQRDGKMYCEIDFDVTVAGPFETNTEEFGASASLGEKATHPGGDHSIGVGASVRMSRATVTRANSSFRRVYNIESPGTEKSTWMESKAPGHKDVYGLTIDDDDAGDTVMTVLADWEIDSYGND